MRRRRRARHAALLGAVALLVAACIHPRPHRAKVVAPIDPMVGADVRELVAANGAPSEILHLPSGQRAYAYSRGRSGHRHPDGRICTDTYVVDHDDMVVDFVCR